MNTNKLKRIAIIAAIVAGLSLLIAGIIAVASGMFESIASGPYHIVQKDRVRSGNINEKKTIPLAGVHNITVKTVSDDITVREVSGDKITVWMHGTSNRTDSTPQLEVDQRGDTAEIRVERPRIDVNWGGWSRGKIVLEVGIPKQYAGKLSVEEVSSDIRLESHGYSELALKTVSGDVQSDGALAVTGSVDAHSVSGDVALSFSTMPSSIVVKTVSGDVHLAVPSNAQYTLETHSVSGDVTSDSQPGGTLGGGKGTIRVNSVSGHIGVTRLGGS